MEIEKFLSSEKPSLKIKEIQQLYGGLPERWELYAQYLYHRMNDVGIKNMGKLSYAELEVKIAEHISAEVRFAVSERANASKS